MKRETGIRKCALFAVAFALTVIPALSQTPAPAKKPSFEVASIKPTAPGVRGGGGGPRGNTFSMSNVTLRNLLVYAYRGNAPTLLNNQISGGPAWIDSDRFEVQAKADCSGGPITAEQLQLMFRSLLEDRCQLKEHIEKRDLPIYNLVVGKSGPTIKRSKIQAPSGASSAVRNPPPALCGPSPTADPAAPPPGTPNWADKLGGVSFDPNGPLSPGMTLKTSKPTAGTTMLRGAAVPIADLLSLLRSDVDRPVIDSTGLTGLFDFKMEYSAERQSGPRATIVPPPQLGVAVGTPGASDPLPLPMLQTAIQQQLGLKLESTKGPVDVLVIDSVRKPSKN